jgi:hypothetical protein
MKPVRIDGGDYLLVRSFVHLTDGSCEQCCFNNESGELCPRGERSTMLCIDHERETRYTAHIIRDTPEDRANYIAQLLTA